MLDESRQSTFMLYGASVVSSMYRSPREIGSCERFLMNASTEFLAKSSSVLPAPHRLFIDSDVSTRKRTTGILRERD